MYTSYVQLPRNVPRRRDGPSAAAGLFEQQEFLARPIYALLLVVLATSY